jgi:hypothetical protein
MTTVTFPPPPPPHRSASRSIASAASSSPTTTHTNAPTTTHSNTHTRPLRPSPPRRSVSQLRLPKIMEEDGTQRILKVGVPNTNRCNNILITSKYTLWTFLPLVRTYVTIHGACSSTCTFQPNHFNKSYHHLINLSASFSFSLSLSLSFSFIKIKIKIYNSNVQYNCTIQIVQYNKTDIAYRI